MLEWTHGPSQVTVRGNVRGTTVTGHVPMLRLPEGSSHDRTPFRPAHPLLAKSRLPLPPVLPPVRDKDNE